MKDDNVYIILDESGEFTKATEKYFIIGGYITNKIFQIRSVHRRIEKEVKLAKKIPLKEKHELKSSNLNYKQQAKFINALLDIPDVYPVAIIVNKETLSKIDEQNYKSSVSFNYFTSQLLKYLLKCEIAILNSTQNIHLRIDNRNVSTKLKHQLATYLRNHSELKPYNKKFIVKYFDSSKFNEIQMADIIANKFYKEYNKPKEKVTENIKRKYMFYVSKFPFKNFDN